MTGWVVGGISGVLAVLVAQEAAAPPPRAPSSIRVSVDLVQIDATVTDAAGRHVPDLDASDFEVLQDGRRQAIASFAYVPAGAAPGAASAAPATGAGTPTGSGAPLAAHQVRRTIALVVDDLGLSFESIARVRRSLQHFVDTQRRPGDLVAVVRTGAGMGALQQFTTDPRLLHAAIDRVRWTIRGRFAPFQATSEFDQRVSPIEQELFTVGTLGSIRYVVRGIGDLPGRKLVILFSDGFRITDADGQYGSILDRMRSLVDEANRAAVVIYGIDARGLMSTAPVAADQIGTSPGAVLNMRRQELADTKDGLRRLAEDTGGLLVTDRNDLAGAIGRVLDDQRGYYLLGYVPERSTFAAANPRFHRLTVRVVRPGLRARSRSGFLGRADERLPAATGDRMVDAVTSPFAGGDITLRLSSFFGQLSNSGPVVQSVMHVDARDLAFREGPDGAREADVEVLAMTFGENGEMADQHRRKYAVRLTAERHATALENGFVYNMRVPIGRPGPYQLRIALRDGTTGRIGSASQFIDVPNLGRKRLALSSLFIQGATDAPAADGALDDLDPNATLAVRRFRRGTRATYMSEIYNVRRDRSGRSKVDSEIRLLREGTEVFRGAPRAVEPAPGGGALLATGVLQLGSETPPGSYVLELTVIDHLAGTHGRATQVIDFEVTN